MWISRKVYEQLQRDNVACEFTAKWMSEHCDRLIKAHKDLLDKYHALRLQGASETSVTVPLQPTVVDPVNAAINSASRGDRALRAIMQSEADKLRAASFMDHEIIERIQSGIESPEGLPA